MKAVAQGIWTPLICLAMIGPSLASPPRHEQSAGEDTAESHSRAADQQRALQLVELLSADDFNTRQAAGKQLLNLGAAALVHVERAARSHNLETRTRAQRLLVQLRDQCFKEDLDAFVRDVAGRKAATLPGWQEFQELMGDGGASREVYVDLFRAVPELFQAAYATKSPECEQPHTSNGPLALLIASRTKTLQNCVVRQQRGLPSEKDRHAASLALLLVGATHPESVSPRSTQHLAQVVRNQLKPLAKGEGEAAYATRQLLSAWMLRSKTNDLYVLSQMLRLADELKLNDVAPLAIAIATSERAYRPSHAQFRASALLVAGKLGDAEDIPSLASLLDDTAVCASQSGRGRQEVELMDVEIRDVALAVTLHLAGEQPAEFGFEKAKSHDEKLFLLHTLAFEDQESRAAALALWQGRPAEQSPRIRIASEPALRR